MSTLEYEIVDVFTDRPFAGNPLAVVFGAAGLANDQLHALGRLSGRDFEVVDASRLRPR